VTWFGPHQFYDSAQRTRELIRHLRSDNLRSQFQAKLQGLRKAPTPEEYVRRCLLAAFYFARQAGISPESFVAGTQALVDWIHSREVVQVECHVIEEPDAVPG
jgi:hypothetical protein